MWGLWPLPLLGAGGTGRSPGRRGGGPGPASPWGGCAGSLPQSLELLAAKPDWTLNWWWAGGTVSMGFGCLPACADAVHLFSSSEPARHLLRQLSEKGECEGQTVIPSLWAGWQVTQVTTLQGG